MPGISSILIEEAEVPVSPSSPEYQQTMFSWDVMPVNAQDHFLNVAVRTLRDMEHWVERFHGGELTNLYLSRREDGWLLTIKAHHKGRAVVAFEFRDSLAECLVMAAYRLATASFKWRPDERLRK